MKNKFCLYVHTKDFAIDGYFTGFYRVQGEDYIACDFSFDNPKIKFFTARNIYKKAENLFSDFAFHSTEDLIYVCDENGKKIKVYNGRSWRFVQ